MSVLHYSDQGLSTAFGNLPFNKELFSKLYYPITFYLWPAIEYAVIIYAWIEKAFNLSKKKNVYILIKVSSGWWPKKDSILN